jgi:hypothetical protein
MPKFHDFSRRTFLRAAGVSIALPLLDAYRSSASASDGSPPARMAFIYVPNGVNILKWMPETTGPDFQWSPTLEVLAEFRADVAVLSGLSHPQAKGGHSGADTWLTGVDLKGTPGYDYRNGVSADQIAAEAIGLTTRIPSLRLSTLGGTGQPGHTQTLSFNRQGIALPAEKNPRLIFDRLFTEDTPISRREKLRRIDEERSILDSILGQAHDLHGRLGTGDRRKLDEYLTAVREVETRVERAEQWMKIPKVKVPSRGIPLNVRPDGRGQNRQYYQTMFDLIFLAFQTDTTRIATYQLCREAHGGFFEGMPLNANHHELSHHGGDPQMLEGLYHIDRYYLEQLAYFLGKLRATPEGDGTMLDRTMVMYGSGMNSELSGTHSGKNLPLVFAGGKSLGFKLGQHRAHQDGVPLSNLLLTMLQRMQLPVDSFHDSTGSLGGLV